MSLDQSNSAEKPIVTHVEMTQMKKQPSTKLTAVKPYRLTDQIGHILRRAFQRHSTIFTNQMVDGLTATRFAALVMLQEKGSLSQNELGRSTAMDIATTTGVVRWLTKQGYVTVGPYPNDARRRLIVLSPVGEMILSQAIPFGAEISEATLEPLSGAEARQLIKLLRKIS